MYDLLLTPTFITNRKKVVKNDQILAKKLNKTLQKLVTDPMYPSLHSHKVNTPDYGERWSSWVTGDIRIIWDYDDENRLIILLLDIGSHSGAHRVYK